MVAAGTGFGDEFGDRKMRLLPDGREGLDQSGKGWKTMARTCIRNGVLCGVEGQVRADLLMDSGRILAIGEDLHETAEVCVDAQGCLVVPGGVDAHTHMDLDVGISRAVDDFFTGTRAAVCGGTTCIVDHMAFGPAEESIHERFAVYRGLADGKVCCDYGLHGVLFDLTPEKMQELQEMVPKGHPSFKLYMTYDKHLDDAEILEVLRLMKRYGGVTAVHAENHAIVNRLRAQFVREGKLTPHYHPLSRPDYVEEEAVERVLRLAHIAGDAPIYIVHLTTRKGLEVARQARARGQKNIYLETCPQYLTLTDERYDEPGLDAFRYVMSPPLRKQEDCDALWEGLRQGEIDVVGTDHCPFNLQIEKRIGEGNFTRIPNGAPGVEERMLLLYSEGVCKGRMTLEDWVAVCCQNPARIFGLYPQKGALVVGADADLFLLDPNQRGKITQTNRHSACDYTTFEGFEVQGQIRSVYVAGELVYDGEQFLGVQGSGRYLERSTLKGLR